MKKIMQNIPLKVIRGECRTQSLKIETHPKKVIYAMMIVLHCQHH